MPSTMNSCKASLILALAAPTALAFQPTNVASRPSVSLQNALRNMASYPENSRQMSSFDAFDRNGAFSGSSQGGMGGRQDMMNGQQEMMNGQMMNSQMMNGQMMNSGYGGGGGGNPNPFSRRGQGGGNDRMYTNDGFNPYSAYGSSHGASQSDRRNGNRGGGMGYQGGPGMMMGGGGGGMMGGMNGVRDTNTMGGFSYSSRVRDQGRTMDQYQGQMQQMQGQMQGGQYGYEGMGGGFDGPMEMMGGFDGGGNMGGMEYQYEQMQQMQGGGHANQSRREHPRGPHRAPSSSRPQQGFSQGSRSHS